MAAFFSLRTFKLWNYSLEITEAASTITVLYLCSRWKHIHKLWPPLGNYLSNCLILESNWLHGWHRHFSEPFCKTLWNLVLIWRIETGYARKPQNMHNYACKNVINKHYQSEVGTGKIKKWQVIINTLLQVSRSSV